MTFPTERSCMLSSDSALSLSLSLTHTHANKEKPRSLEVNFHCSTQSNEMYNDVDEPDEGKCSYVMHYNTVHACPKCASTTPISIFFIYNIMYHMTTMLLEADLFFLHVEMRVHTFTYIYRICHKLVHLCSVASSF